MEFYKESKDLALCRKRKVHLLLNCICDFRDNDIRNLLNDTNYKDFEEIDNKLNNILDYYRKMGNYIVEYYYPDAETTTLDDLPKYDD